MEKVLIDAFRYYRGRHGGVRHSLRAARDDIAAYALAKAGFGFPGRGEYWKPDSLYGFTSGGRGFASPGAPWGRYALQWCEDPGAIGLRFVGFADEISRRGGYRGVDHTGWFTDPHGDGNVCRGVVYQLPGRNGKARYVYGYREGFGGRNGWTDAAGIDGAAALALRDVQEHVTDSYWDMSGAYEAAHMADGVAEHHAEQERDYQEAWQAAARWERLAEDAAEFRTEARELIRDMRKASRSVFDAAGRFPESICRTLRAAVKDKLESMRDALDERRTLESDFSYLDSDGRRLDLQEFRKVYL